jgi:hypothetical protein
MEGQQMTEPASRESAAETYLDFNPGEIALRLASGTSRNF